MKKLRPFLGFAGLAAWLFVLGVDIVHADTPTEYEVKAAFLYNFAKFVEWPPEALQKSGDAFTVCIIGEDPFGAALKKQFEGKTIQDKRFEFRRLRTVEEGLGCPIVFIGTPENENIRTFVGALHAAPVLTVGETSRFIQEGGMVGFAMENKRVRFNINALAAEKSGLKISSQLLKLAKTVIPPAAEPSP